MSSAFHDEGYGYDLFGLHPAMVDRVAHLGAPIHDRYFRVTSEGAEHLPRAGRSILIANHGGCLPVDAAMLWLDVLRHTGRVARMVADRMVPRLPWLSTLFARVGVVSGTRANVRRLLDNDELLAIFPEGVAGVAKPASERYQLQKWQVGHAELAIRHRAPVIPVAILGAEESWPLLLRLQLPVFGAPYVPVPRYPVPLPVHYHVIYGAPIELHRGVRPWQVGDPATIARAAEQTHDAVARLVADGLAARRRS